MIFIHPTAEVSPAAEIGDETKIWHQAQVREGARVGRQCTLGKGVYIDCDVQIGDRVKIENYVSVWRGVTIEDGAFIGPQVIFTTDRCPRAITPAGRPQGPDDWTLEPILIRAGASLGAGAIILPGVTVGRFAMVGAGAVVTRDVPDHAIMLGNPARARGYACICGRPLAAAGDAWSCAACGRRYRLVAGDLRITGTP